MKSGNNIRKELIFEAGDCIFQAKLPLFKAGQAQLVHLMRGFKGNDRFVEIPMLLFQLCKRLPQRSVVLSVHQTPRMTP
jgi:hypothetical protein